MFVFPVYEHGGNERYRAGRTRSHAEDTVQNGQQLTTSTFQSLPPVIWPKLPPSSTALSSQARSGLAFLQSLRLLRGCPVRAANKISRSGKTVNWVWSTTGLSLELKHTKGTGALKKHALRHLYLKRQDGKNLHDSYFLLILSESNKRAWRKTELKEVSLLTFKTSCKNSSLYCSICYLYPKKPIQKKPIILNLQDCSVILWRWFQCCHQHNCIRLSSLRFGAGQIESPAPRTSTRLAGILSISVLGLEV